MPNPPWLAANGAPQPYVGHDGWLHVPPDLAGSLDGWTGDYTRRVALERPASVRGPLRIWAERVREFAHASARTAGPPAIAVPVVLEAPQIPASSPSAEITVAQAAGLLHVTDERVRQLLRRWQTPGPQNRPGSCGWLTATA